MSAGINVAGRFAAPELLNLGPPPRLASKTPDEILSITKPKLVAGMTAIGVPIDVENLETDPTIVLTQNSAHLTSLRLNAIDDAAAQGYVGSATGAHLAARAADYGVLRRTWLYTGDSTSAAEPARPADLPPRWTWDGVERLWREDDDSLRTQARLAWEALSVAGPRGAYAFHAVKAHPDVLDPAVYGPEHGVVEPGQVLIVVQSHTGTGVPTPGVLDAIADRLDAHRIRSGSGVETIRPVRDDQSVRPLGAEVIVEACRRVEFDIEATLYLRPGPGAAEILAEARSRLDTYLDDNRRIGQPITRSGLTTVLSVADAAGQPTVEDLDLVKPAADVEPAYNQIAVAEPGFVSVRMAVR